MAYKIDFGLRFPGTCEQAFKFYQSVFGGELFMLQRYKEMKPHGYKIEQEDEEKIAFVALRKGKETILAGDDQSKLYPKELVQGNNITIAVSVGSIKEAKRLYDALSEGGTDKTPLADVYWGDYCGGCTDKFGIQWYISYHYPKIQ